MNHVVRVCTHAATTGLASATLLYCCRKFHRCTAHSAGSFGFMSKFHFGLVLIFRYAFQHTESVIPASKFVIQQPASNDKQWCNQYSKRHCKIERICLIHSPIKSAGHDLVRYLPTKESKRCKINIC